jgi:predicted ester cyclase
MLSVFPNQFLNLWTHFHKTKFESYVFLVIPPDIRNVQFCVHSNSHMEDVQICEVASIFHINSNI